MFLCELRHELWTGQRGEGGACHELISLVASGCKSNRGIQRSKEKSGAGIEGGKFNLRVIYCPALTI